VFPLKPKEGPSTSAQGRAERLNKRRKIIVDDKESRIPDVGNEVVVEEPSQQVKEEIDEIGFTDIGVNCTLISDKSLRWSISRLENDAKAIQFYTGLRDYKHFRLVFNLLGKAAYHLKYKCSLLPPIDQFFMTMIKLRLNKPDVELSFMFNVSTSTVSTLFNTWVNFMYYQFKEINIWPSRKIVDDHMPTGFKAMFPTTRVILDATEVPIIKPSNVVAQSATFSTYKNKNTLKTMIGITPRGAVSHISESYGGCASDRQIIERSDLLEKGKFESGDSIMADRGIMVQDLFASKNVKVNTPHMLKGKSQLEAHEVVYDRRIASKRIHIERVIGYGKTFKILKEGLQVSQVNNGSRIIYICFFLTNLRKCIVSETA